MQGQGKDEQAKRKRVLNACKRCRKHKIRCSGTDPCKTCDQRSLKCEFDVEEKKVSVSESYLNDLKRKVSDFEQGHSQPTQQVQEDNRISPLRRRVNDSSLSSPIRNSNDLQQRIRQDAQPNNEAEDAENDHRESSVEKMHNPLVRVYSSYTLDVTGRLRHHGHSSTWAFSRQVLEFTQKHSPLPNPSVNVEGEAYQLHTDDPPTVDWSLLPSREVALFLLETVKFRIGPMFHLFESNDFQTHLDRLYADPPIYWQSERLGFIRFLVVIALGKSIASNNQTGLKIFKHALRLLPDVAYLCGEPGMATELLCGISLYYQCIDHRSAAHVSIGQALRIAQAHGLHTDVQARDVGQATVGRFRKIWWTIYCLDRRMSTLMGIPQGLHDQDITAPLTSPPYMDKIFILNVKLNEQFGNIVSTVYNVNGRLNTTLVPTAQSVLRGIASLSQEIVEFADHCFGTSRIAAHLQLAYHQCIMLTTRPFLFHLLQKGLETGNVSAAFPLSVSIKGLVQACVDSALQAVSILTSLRQQDLLDAFLPFDLDTAFSAAFVLLMAHRIHPKLVADTPWLSSLFEIFDNMTLQGSLMSSLRKQEVEELNSAMQNLNTLPRGAIAPDQSDPIDHASLPSLGDPFFEDWNPDDGISGTQLMNLANELSNESLNDFWMYESSALQDFI